MTNQTQTPRNGIELEIVSDDAVKAVITREMAFRAVRQAFVSVAEGKTALFPVLAARAAHPGTAVNIKFGYDEGAGTVGFKAGTFWPDNRARGLSNHGATTLLLDFDSGFPQALVNAATLNRFRTAAANAVAVDTLSRTDAKTYGIFGAGQQSEYEVRAVAEVRRLERILIGARSRERAEALAERLSDLGTDIEIVEPRIAAGADIVTTITNARGAIISEGWLKPGSHVSAMGADSLGKQELDPRIFGGATIFADDPQQSAAIGESQHAVAMGVISRAQIRAIGDVLRGVHAGRSNAHEITIFDSSGLAAQDLVVASNVLDAARRLGLVEQISF